MPRFTTCEKNVACGINSWSRCGMFSCPSGRNVSSSRAPPPNVTTTTLRGFVGAPRNEPAATAPVASRRNSRRLCEMASATPRLTSNPSCHMIMESVIAALLLFLAATPTFEEAFRNGLLALQRNDLAAAESNLTAAAQLQPQNARVWVALARTWWKREQPAKANDA